MKGPAWRGFHRLNAYTRMRRRQVLATVRLRAPSVWPGDPGQLAWAA